LSEAAVTEEMETVAMTLRTALVAVAVAVDP
jgi:hypothetical protein